MIKQNIMKVNLFLQGIMVRLNENIDYFSYLTVNFKSGVKEFSLNISYNENDFLYDYLGVSNIININEIPKFICDELTKYDSAVITYSDRINTLEITADDKNVSSKNIENTNKNTVTKNATVGGRNYIIKESEAKDLLKAIGIMAENGKIKNDMVRKYNQIDRFAEFVSDINFGDNITVMDCACGKSYLSFALNYYFTEILKKKCSIYGIDYNESVIASSNEIKDKLRYYNMEFIQADLKEFNLNKKVDLVISLHACDVATDYALYSGIKHKSKAIICVPCCHKELSNQITYEPFDSILKHGILRRRFCDILTDSLRTLLLEANGYKVAVTEYTSPLDTPKNIMLKAIKVSDRNEKALEEYYKLKEQFKVYPTLEMLLNS